jgi:hypothetical protein
LILKEESIMKKSIILSILLSTFVYSSAAFADQYVRGYTRKDGTYVQGHMRSDPDSTVTNNYSFSGNTNPYTGSVGTNRYVNDRTSPYFSGADSDGNVGHDNSSDSFGNSGAWDK